MMKSTITGLLAAAALIASGASAFAQETPLWVRKNAISPDGTQIAFSYKGNIWTVNTKGGRAEQITSSPAYESDPIWTKDSKEIVFSSFREGGRDIFITSAGGGTPRKVTDLPGNEIPKAVLADGRIIFSAAIGAEAEYDGFPGGSQLYIIGKNGGRASLVTPLQVSEISVNNAGDIIYEDYKGYEDPLRKHHTSSVTRDIWYYKGNNSGNGFTIDRNGTFTRLSTYTGEDRQPVFAADGRTFYYLSEQDGKAMNIFRGSIDGSAPVQLTHFEKNPVRFISVADNGTIAMSWNGELYTMQEGSEPKKVEITVIGDNFEKEMTRMTLTGGANALAVSPDGKEVAVAVRGDIFVTSADYATTRRITNTPEQERDVCFSPDGRAIYYSAERNGFWGIYRTVLTDKNDKLFTYASRTKEELVSDEGETCFQPSVSPDGKYVAYLRNREDIVVKPVKGGKSRTLLENVNYSYSDGDQEFEWSPDSRYLLCNYQADGGWNNQDVALINVESGEITNITQSGYSDGDFRWALGGKAMTWTSDKNGYRSHGSWGAETDIYIMFFDRGRMTEFLRDKEGEEIAKLQMTEKELKKEEKKDSADKKKPEKLKLLLDGRENRIIRLTRSSSRYYDHYLTQDGSKLFYIAPLERSYDLCELDIKEGDIKVIQKGVAGGIIPSKDDKYIYIASSSGLNRIPVAGGPGKSISFNGEFEFRPKEERAYIFSHIWKQVKEKFYVEDLHGCDWDYYKANYERFLPYITNNFDFQDLLSEMLGELNGSHTGARYSHRGGEAMSYLGAIYDHAYTGDGLKIKELLVDGVLSLADPEIKEGDIIESIDGHEIKAGESWQKYLAGKAGKRITVKIRKGGKSEEIFVKPAYASQENDLLYRRWVRRREEMVEKLSGGKVGYVHVEGMDSPSFREVFSKALGKYRTCEALIVDTRHNGGGWLHEDLVNFLSGKVYVRYEPRGRFIGNEPFVKWTKPSCVLVGEDNYSDASGFPYAYQALGLGKLIGAPVPGTMTAVWWETQIDNSLVFGIPQVGNWGVKAGRFMENNQVEPDILVLNDPASVLAGEDRQLEAAVAEMLKTIEKK